MWLLFLANQVAGSYKVEFVATRVMVDGCTYLKSGFSCSCKNLTDADLTLANVGKKGSADNSGVVEGCLCQQQREAALSHPELWYSRSDQFASAKAALTL